MEDKLDIACAIALGIVVGTALGVYVGISDGRYEIRKQAIEHNYAQYHPQTGEFVWLKEVGE